MEELTGNENGYKMRIGKEFSSFLTEREFAMSLRNHIVIEELVEQGFSVFVPSKQETLVSAIRYYSERDALSSDTLWILDNDNLSAYRKAVSSKDLCLVVAMTGHVAEVLRQQSAPNGILRSPTGMSKEAVLTVCQSVLTDYLQWKQTVLTTILEKKGFQDILETAAAPLKNPIAVFDVNMFVLAKSSFSEELPTGTIWDLLDRDQLFISDFYEPGELEALAEDAYRGPSRSALFHPKKDPEHTYYTQVLYDQDETIGTIGMVDLFHPLTDGQIAWAEEIVQLLQLYLQYHQSYTSQETISETFLRTVSERSPLSSEEWQSGLQELFWEDEEEHLVATIYRQEPFRTELDKRSYLNLIALALPASICFFSGNQIHAVFRTADYSPLDVSWLTEWEAFLRRNRLFCGLSYSFRELSLLPDTLEQSRFAAQTAYDNDLSLCRFSEVYRDYVSTLLTEHVSQESLIHPGIRVLAKEGGDTLVQCLYSYLLNGRNIADTARAMYLHRNTLIYRLGKIEEVLGKELKSLSDEELLPLLVSCFLFTR